MVKKLRNSKTINKQRFVKMKHIILLIMLISICSSSIAQNKFKFPTVNLPDSVVLSLTQFLSQKEKSPVTGAIFTFNLINKNSRKFQDGIYSFKIFGSHFRRNIFIVRHKKIHIFKAYDLNELLPEFYDFLKENNLSRKIEIDYLKAISLFLEQEYISENG